MDEEVPQVTVFGLGGTIAMTAGESGAVPALHAKELLAAVPGLAEVEVQVRVEELRRVPGAWLGFEDLAEVFAAVEARWEAGDAGVVVMQGTDTIEETAYLLDLWHTGPQPLVVTGAMRHAGLPGADGPANLFAAVQVAASDTLAGEGAVVVLNDEIHAARRVRKAHTASPAAFRSPDGGPLGYVVEGRPRVLGRLERRVALPQPVEGARPRVAVVTMAFGEDGTVLRAASGQVDGLVIAGMGAGHVPRELAEVLEDIQRRIPVVLASRTFAGPVLSTSYGFEGSERDLLDRGLISAGYLEALKARVLLMALLGAESDRTTIAAAFEAVGGGPQALVETA